MTTRVVDDRALLRAALLAVLLQSRDTSRLLGVIQENLAGTLSGQDRLEFTHQVETFRMQCINAGRNVSGDDAARAVWDDWADVLRGGIEYADFHRAYVEFFQYSGLCP